MAKPVKNSINRDKQILTSHDYELMARIVKFEIIATQLQENINNLYAGLEEMQKQLIKIQKKVNL